MHLMHNKAACACRPQVYLPHHIPGKWSLWNSFAVRVQDACSGSFKQEEIRMQDVIRLQSVTDDKTKETCIN